MAYFFLLQVPLCLIYSGYLITRSTASPLQPDQANGTITNELGKRYGEPYYPSIRREPIRRMPVYRRLDTAHNTDRDPSYAAGSSKPERPTVFTYDNEVCPRDNGRILFNGLDCPAAIDRFGPYLCYKYERRYKSCCEKCIQLKDDRRSGCEYGDHSYQCRTLEAHYCYERHNREVCCDTCQRHRQTFSNGSRHCEYGDMTPRCKYINPSMCYRREIERICCQTCHTLKNKYSQGCPYGDREYFLCSAALLDRARCYRPQTQNICCNVCSRLKLSIPDCPYGNHHVSFKTSVGNLNCEHFIRIYGREECKHPTIKTRCCASCRPRH